jgi:hypothetical protein
MNKTIKTELSTTYIPLIKIFFEANDMHNVIVDTYSMQVRDYIHDAIQVTYDQDNEDTAGKIAYMSIVHAGFLNMLDDFLIKCNISPYHLQPETMKTQKYEETFRKGTDLSLNEISKTIEQGN